MLTPLDKEYGPVIDFRIRPPYKDYLNTVMYSGAARRDGITRKIGFEPSPAATEQSVALLLEEMDAAGIAKGVVVGRSSGALGSVGNDVVKEFCDLHPGRFVPVGSIDPVAWKAAPESVDVLLSGGFKAIAIEPGGASLPLHTDDRRLYPLYAHCEARKVPMIIMTGGNAGPDISYSAPEHLDRMLADFPSLRVVSAHGNWPWVHQILHVALRRPNLYLSPDYLLANMPGMDDYIRAADSWLSDRILYASAFPFAPVGKYLEWFLRMPIRPDSMKRILCRNAAELLSLDMPVARQSG
ncbi:MAG: amidohydrolase family protein [Betaproteobacteria bacterium]|nr:amidohydrolase family protein [Betaproteobacteria bacterium]